MSYSPTGLGGNLYDLTTIPPTLLATGGLSDSLSQLFAFKYPTYSASLTLTLPLKNHAAEADLADAMVSQKNDQYREAREIQSITLEVKNAVHLLEQAKLSLEAAKVSENLARKSLQAEQRKYQLGGSTVFLRTGRANAVGQRGIRVWRRRKRITRRRWQRSITLLANCWSITKYKSRLHK